MKITSILSLAGWLVLGPALAVPAFNAHAAEAGAEPREAPPAPAEPELQDKFTARMGVMVGLSAVVLGCGIPLLAIWSDYQKKRGFLQACHQERMAALERGLEVPPFPEHFLANEEGSATPDTGLKGGLIWSGIGIGMALWLGTQTDPRIHPWFSAIPLGIGIGYLIYYVIEGKKRFGQRDEPEKV